MTEHTDENQTFETWLPAGAETDGTGDADFVPCLPFEDPQTAEEPKAPPEPSGPTREEIIAEAHQQAEEIIESAQVQAEQIKQQARQEMDQKVQERIQQETQRVRQEQTQAFERTASELLTQFQAAAEEHMERLERGVAELVSGIVEKVIARKVAADDDIVVDVTREALRQLDDARRLTVIVNPEDEAAVSDHRDEFLQAAGRLEEIRIATDTDIQPGGCLLDSEVGEVDARIQSQLDAIWDAITTTARQKAA
jgi:flagellar assembly protein FliH